MATETQSLIAGATALVGTLILAYSIYKENATAVTAVTAKKAAKSKKKKKKKKAERVPVGIGVVAYDQETKRIIVGLRKGSHGSGTWALPGGWLEKGESIAGCAIREMAEETGLTATSFAKNPITLDCPPCLNSEYNSLSIFVLVALKKGVSHRPKVMEPEKCAEWKWVDPKMSSMRDAFPSLAHFLSLGIDLDRKC